MWSEVEIKILSKIISNWLKTLSKEDRILFVRRYWYGDSIKELAISIGTTLYDEDLAKFRVDKDNPTYIIVDNGGKVIATASLILDEYNRSGKKGRFRIIHSFQSIKAKD